MPPGIGVSFFNTIAFSFGADLSSSVSALFPGTVALSFIDSVLYVGVGALSFSTGALFPSTDALFSNINALFSNIDASFLCILLFVHTSPPTNSLILSTLSTFFGIPQSAFI